jgi:hypothetical protein
MAASTSSIEVQTIVAIRAAGEAPRLIIEVADVNGRVFALSLALEEAAHLATFIQDVTGLLNELRKRPSAY